MTVTFEMLTTRDHAWNLDDFVDVVNRALPEVVPRDAAKRAKVEVNARLVRHYTTEGALPRPLKDGVEARYDSDHLVRMLALRRLLLEGYPSGVAAALLRKHDRETLARFLLGEFRLELELASGGVSATPTPLDHLPPHQRERLAAMRARAGLPALEHEGGPPPLDAEGGPTRLEAEGGPPPLDADDDEPDASTLPHRRDRDASNAPIGRSFASFLRAPPGPPRHTQPAPADDEDTATAPAAATWTRHQLLPSLELHVREDFEHPTTLAGLNALRDALIARLEAIALTRPRDD